jgi:hypothetical protein
VSHNSQEVEKELIRRWRNALARYLQIYIDIIEARNKAQNTPEEKQVQEWIKMAKKNEAR